ncbi:hypothetical protein CC80DRAFT_491971 [Byssothecium circinans]|uniref:DRBM domain-containing protein n=1 Tax=Byssothecium circinans TaxID=147558 RepID=A0A6A5U7Q1_9PLEO|nr:hypothetical protein CC80DRAFT_491971 [Byssothecium circinans]
MGLFFNNFDLWFAKAIVQFHLAMAIQKEHLGHATVNPKDVIEQVEARYWRGPSQDVGGNVDFYPGSELFGRIKAARATKDDKTLQTFLDQLSSDIVSSCRRLRNEKVAELDAGPPFSPDHIHRATTPSSSTSTDPSSEDSREATDTATEAESSSQENGVQSTTLSAPGGLPMAWYTSLLYEYAARSGEKPEYKKERVSFDVWRCKAIFNGIQGVGEAQSWKIARHIASQNICQTLGIMEE